MATIPVKVLERFKETIPRLQKILDSAKNRDVNEADTVTIVADILALVCGYDKYSDITKEYAVKGTFCDLAIKIDDTVKFLIEVKAIGITLHDRHYQQALDYGANLGVEWIILTNGLIWRVYKVKFEKPIKTDFVCEISFMDIKLKSQSDLDRLYILCKEGLKKNAIDEFAQHKLVVNKFFISSIFMSGFVNEAIKRELKKIDPGVRPEDEEIIALIKNDIVKRELIDSPDAIEAIAKFEKLQKKAQKEKDGIAKAKEKAILPKVEEPKKE